MIQELKLIKVKLLNNSHFGDRLRQRKVALEETGDHYRETGFWGEGSKDFFLF